MVSNTIDGKSVPNVARSRPGGNWTAREPIAPDTDQTPTDSGAARIRHVPNAGWPCRCRIGLTPSLSGDIRRRRTFCSGSVVRRLTAVRQVDHPTLGLAASGSNRIDEHRHGSGLFIEYDCGQHRTGLRRGGRAAGRCQHARSKIGGRGHRPATVIAHREIRPSNLVTLHWVVNLGIRVFLRTVSGICGFGW